MTTKPGPGLRDVIYTGLILDGYDSYRATRCAGNLLVGLRPEPDKLSRPSGDHQALKR